MTSGLKRYEIKKFQSLRGTWLKMSEIRSLGRFSSQFYNPEQCTKIECKHKDGRTYGELLGKTDWQLL